MTLEADRFNRDEVITKLTEWLRCQCRQELVPQLAELSRKHDLPINKTAIRNQRTRWGSCSAKKNVSLNMKLLFLPRELVRYVFVHELCHVRELNHTKRFWRLVESIEPQYRVYDTQLREA